MKNIVHLLFCYSFVTFSFAQGPSDLWTRSIGGSESERGNAVLSTNDGGCIFVGSASSSDGDVIGLHSTFGWNYSDFWVVKLNSEGIIEWQRCLGGNKSEEANEIVQVSDGGYVIVGSAISNDGDLTWHYGSDSFNDLWIIKIDETGNLLWQKTYGGYSEEYASSVDETTDGGLIISAILNADYNGTVPITYSGSMDFWVLKLNSIGEMQWNNHYGGENGDRARCIKSTPDGGCIVVGQSGSHYGDVTTSIGPFNTDIPDFWILKLNSTGIIQWQKSYGGLQSDWATAIDLTSDGGYIIAGNTASNNTNVTNYHGGVDGWAIKLNAIGELEWQKCIGGSSTDYLNSIIQTIDGGYLVCGTTASTDGDLNGIIAGNKAWIVKLTGLGNVSWQRHYMQQPNYNAFNDIVQNPDGTCIVVGYLNQYNDNDNYDIFTVKLDVNSNTLTTSNFITSEVILYPNAVDDILYIQSGSVTFKQVTVYDVLGKKLTTLFVENNSVNLSSFQKGIYFLEIRNEWDESVMKKIIKN